MNVLVTWMYSSPEHEDIHHSQTGANSGSQEVKNYYWRCVFLLFESSSRVNSSIRHILFLNEMPPEEIDGINTKKLLEQYAIEIHVLDKVTVSPKDYHRSWNSQFIVIDILEKLSCLVEDHDIVMVLDSDMIFNRPITCDFERRVRNEKALLYTINYTKSCDINGLNLFDLLQISNEITEGFPALEFIYSGGEFVCCLGSEIVKIAGLARGAYNTSLERHRKGLKKFNEEAHLLSYVYHVLGYKNGSANKYVKRIWTNRTVYSNVNGYENDLMLWHLPAEKKRGFVEVFRTYHYINGKYFIKKNALPIKYRVVEPFGEKVSRYYAKIKCRVLG